MRRGPGGEAMKIKPPMFIASSHIGADVGSWAHPMFYRGVEEEYVVVVVCISQLARSALCFIRWELHRPRLISGLLLPLILHILGEQ